MYPIKQYRQYVKQQNGNIFLFSGMSNRHRYSPFASPDKIISILPLNSPKLGIFSRKFCIFRRMFLDEPKFRGGGNFSLSFATTRLWKSTHVESSASRYPRSSSSRSASELSSSRLASQLVRSTQPPTLSQLSSSRLASQLVASTQPPTLSQLSSSRLASQLVRSTQPPTLSQLSSSRLAYQRPPHAAMPRCTPVYAHTCTLVQLIDWLIDWFEWRIINSSSSL